MDKSIEDTKFTKESDNIDSSKPSDNSSENSYESSCCGAVLMNQALEMQEETAKTDTCCECIISSDNKHEKEDTIEINQEEIQKKPKEKAASGGIDDLLSSAAKLYKKYQYAEAIALLEKATEALYTDGKNPNYLKYSIEIMLLRIQINEIIGKWNSALSDCDAIIDAARDMEDRHPVILAHFIRGTILGDRGHYRESAEILKSGLSIADKAEDIKGTAILCCALGKLYSSTGEATAGRKLLERAEQIASKNLEDPEMKRIAAAVHNQMGLFHYRKREIDESIKIFNETIEILKDDHDSSERAMALRYLGVVYCLKGMSKKALKYHSMALEIYKKTGNKFGQAKIYNSIGRTLADAGKLNDAIYFMEKAEVICSDLGADAEAANIYGRLGSVYMLKEEFDTAKKFFQRDIEISKKFENVRARAFAYRNIGECNIYLGKNKEAIDCLRTAADFFKKMGDSANEKLVMLNLCTAYINEGNLEEASRISEELFKAEPSIEKTYETALHQMVLGIIERHKRNWVEASKHLNTGIELMKSSGKSLKLAELYFEYGLLCLSIHDKEGALSKFCEAYKISRELELTKQQKRYFTMIERINDLEIVKVLIEELE